MHAAASRQKFTKPPEQTLDMSLYNLKTRSYKNNLIHIIKPCNNSMIKASDVFKLGLVNLKRSVHVQYLGSARYNKLLKISYIKLMYTLIDS